MKFMNERDCEKALTYFKRALYSETPNAIEQNCPEELKGESLKGMIFIADEVRKEFERSISNEDNFHKFYRLKTFLQRKMLTTANAFAKKNKAYDVGCWVELSLLLAALQNPDI